MTLKIQSAYARLFNSHDEVSIDSIGGGSINYTYGLRAKNHECFLKTNSSKNFPGMFEAEEKGLRLLAAKSSFRIPKTFGVVEIDNDALLFMELIKSGPQKADFWTDFGSKLAELHRSTQANFGLNSDNYIGSLPQRNNPSDSWIEFFIEQRLQPLLKLAIDSGSVSSDDLSSFKSLEKKLADFFPTEPPALLHGDLWSGNYLVGNKGEPVLIDPAVHYGHRYMDLGMMKLFGGFDSQVIVSYQEHYPLDSDWQDGIEIANLYPLLVHVILFGGGYISSVRSILKSFT